MSWRGHGGSRDQGKTTHRVTLESVFSFCRRDARNEGCHMLVAKPKGTCRENTVSLVTAHMGGFLSHLTNL